MKAVIMEDGRAVLKDLEVPALQDGDVLVEMRACGLCGTDIEKICGHYTASQPILGHEPSGVVAESMSPYIKKGSRVFAHHHVPCYDCYYCKRRSFTMCPYYRKTNLDPGGFSEYFRVPNFNVSRGAILVLPSHVTFDEGSLIEPLATVVRAHSRIPLGEGDSVFISGAGPMGDLHLLMSKYRGAGKVIVSDISEYRLSFAERLGADHVVDARSGVETEVVKLTEGRGADLAIVASGHPSAILSALRSVRKGGTVLLFGVPFKGTILQYDISDLLNNEINIVTSNAAYEEETREALKLIAEGKIRVSEIITHKYSLEDFHHAVKEAKEGNVIKAVITS